ncbi:hypothetical protein [Geodermatophilus sp. SYSU D00079]
MEFLLIAGLFWLVWLVWRHTGPSTYHQAKQERWRRQAGVRRRNALDDAWAEGERDAERRIREKRRQEVRDEIARLREKRRHR